MKQALGEMKTDENDEATKTFGIYIEFTTRSDAMRNERNRHTNYHSNLCVCRLLRSQCGFAHQLSAHFMTGFCAPLHKERRIDRLGADRDIGEGRGRGEVIAHRVKGDHLRAELARVGLARVTPPVFETRLENRNKGGNERRHKAMKWCALDMRFDKAESIAIHTKATPSKVCTGMHAHTHQSKQPFGLNGSSVDLIACG